MGYRGTSMVGGPALDLHLGQEHQTVPQGRQGHLFHIVRGHEVAAGNDGVGL
jgi:hypothetical protein